jgi:hypothetical protein
MVEEEVEAAVAGYVADAVARGAQDCTQIVADAGEVLSGVADWRWVRELAWPLVGPAFAAHLEAQAGWPERTDNDRLTDAFRALDAAGVVAREDFTCCQTCGINAIDDEVTGELPAHGYVFYHGYDTIEAVQGGGVWLAFGAMEADGPPDEEIGDQVVAALRAEGLEVEWDRSAGDRPHVQLEWARRRHGRLAAYPSGPVGAEIGVVGGHLPEAVPRHVLERVELPWLPAGLQVWLTDGEREVTVHREYDRLVSADGRSAGRFEGLRLLGDEAAAGEPEPGLLEVTHVDQPAGRPAAVPEIMDVLRRQPTRTGAWLHAVSRSGRTVRTSWDDGRLRLESPAGTPAVVTFAEAERAFTTLA